MKDRLVLIRKNIDQHKKISQEKFAELLGTSRNAIASYEYGKVVPSDTFIQLLCTKFNVNENWLRNGEGSMYVETNDSVFEAFAQKYSLSSAERDIARYCLELTAEQRAEILKHILNVAEIIKATDSEKEPDSALNAFPMPTVSSKQNTNKVKPSKKKMSTEMKEAILNAELTDEKRVKMS